MAEFRANPTVTVTYTMTLTEAEMRALKLAADFGATAAICDMSAEFKPHQGALTDFFKSVREEAGKRLKRTDDARGVLAGNMLAVKPREGESA